MARKAFIVGVSTKNLRYCENDADLMGECLERYGYDIIKPTFIDKWVICREFEDMTKTCGLSDTVIVYFSGHGKVEKNELDFILNNDEIITLNSQIVRMFDRCKAGNKLIILDCCNAGTATHGWNAGPSENYRFLTASHFLEEAKEIDKWKAGFFTYKIHQALTRHPPEIRNGDQIQVKELFEWLLKETENHNKDNSQPIKVPKPHLFGDQQVNFCIGVVGEIQKLSKEIEILQGHVKHLELEISTLKGRLEKVEPPEKLPTDDLTELKQLAERELPDEIKERQRAHDILNNNEKLQKDLIDESIRGSSFLVKYSYLSFEDREALEFNLLKCMNWLIESLVDPVGAPAGVKRLKLDDAILREARTPILEYMKDQLIPQKIVDVDVCYKIQQYLDILINKLTNQ